MRPSIDHGLLSPSGGMSKRARKAALERTRKELFGDGLPGPVCPQEDQVDSLLRWAKEWRDLAARGMCPRKFRKQAEAAEKEVARIINERMRP